MRLYEFPPTRSIRPRWMLQELGVEFEAIQVDLGSGAHRQPAFREINPAGRVPALADGDVVVTESVAIVLYLAEKYPERGLLPGDLVGRGQLYRWLFFVVTELEQPLWRISHHTFLYPEDQRLPAEIPLARQDFLEMAPVLDEHLRGREFLIGDRVSVGDFVTAYTLDWANETRLLEDFPDLASYMERMYQRSNAPPRIAEALASVGL
jgi:glutathione S-transferase